MNLIFTKNYKALSVEAAEQIADEAAGKPNAAIVVATGNTPIGAYAHLAILQNAGHFDSAKLQIFQLDEYLGLAADDKRTLWGWMEKAFVAPLHIDPASVIRLPCDTTDAHAACQAYDAAVAAAGGFDLAILGLGPNGHLAFNEPPSDHTVNTRPIKLTEDSLVSNSVYWGGKENVPLQAMTAGMSQLLGAKKIILLVSGKSKREILERVMNGPVSAACPASYLQLHADVLVIADEEAAR